jgi:spermidine/putrescine transport system permease protein
VRRIHRRLPGGLDVVIVLVMIYLMLPIAIIILFSFNSTTAAAFPIQGFTLRWYQELFGNRMLLEGLKNSVIVGLGVSIVSVTIGTLASFALTRHQFRLKQVVTFSVLVPITLPPIVIGVALLSFFSGLKIPRSLLTVAISHVLFCAPFAILVMNARLEGFDIAVEEAAMDLGANRWQTFRYVTFPLIRPSLIGALMLAFGLSFDEFLVTFFVVGRKNTLPIVIWGMLRRGISPSINAIATMVLIISMTLIVVANRYAKLKILH